MVEFREIFPGFERVACLATKRRPTCADLCHAIAKLSVMRIFMTGGALEAVEAKCGGLGKLRGPALFVAFAAGNCQMCTNERIPRGAVLGQREC